MFSIISHSTTTITVISIITIIIKSMITTVSWHVATVNFVNTSCYSACYNLPSYSASFHFSYMLILISAAIPFKSNERSNFKFFYIALILFFCTTYKTDKQQAIRVQKWNIYRADHQLYMCGIITLESLT